MEDWKEGDSAHAYYDFSTRPSRIENWIRRIARTDLALLPACVRARPIDCQDCSLTNPEACLIARDPHFASYLIHQIELDLIHRIRIGRHRPPAIRDAIRRVLQEHGRPLHWDIIVAMVRDRFPKMRRYAPDLIYGVLAASKDDFERVEPGVYWLAQRESR